MKRLFAGTALAAVLATGAFAATEDEMAAIQKYAPDVDVSTMSEQQIDAVMNVINSGDSEGEKSAKISATGRRGRRQHRGVRGVLGPVGAPAAICTGTGLHRDHRLRA
ncbi:hypothetical protein [Ponticoccus litoralis]|uniref:Uncharacterized protein n=1 Tax=Ponticoccus litoralis TaxID=422297 RepID=A0AAW9SII2_9RHOB